MLEEDDSSWELQAQPSVLIYVHAHMWSLYIHICKSKRASGKNHCTGGIVTVTRCFKNQRQAMRLAFYPLRVHISNVAIQGHHTMETRVYTPISIGSGSQDLLFTYKKV